MKALALALALVLPLQARAADDAPILLEAGAPAPVAGVLLPNALAVTQAKRVTSCEEKVKVYEAAPPPMHPAAVVALVVVGVLAGGAAGFAIAQATR